MVDSIIDKHIPLEERVRKAAQDSSIFNQTHVIFGGTGAVGGETAIQMIELYENMMRINPPSEYNVPTIVLTGISREEIIHFRKKLQKIFPETKSGKQSKKHAADYNEELLTPSGIRIRLYTFRADPAFSRTEAADFDGLKVAIQQMSSPLEDFLDSYKGRYRITDPDFRFASVISGIPIPSIATYKMNEFERMCRERGITDEKQIRQLKDGVVKKIAQGLGNIMQRYANEVLVAHTTAVGGMYDIHEGGSSDIRLGFAHSGSVDLLKIKRYYAELLTQEYSRLGLKTLITAAAIGINDILDNVELDYNGDILAALRKSGVIPERFLTDGYIRALPFKEIRLGEESHEELNFTEETRWGKPQPTKGRVIRVDRAVISGENGKFSIDNALALYLVMKVASQTELAIPMATTAMFGDDPNKPWFDERGICFYTETENSNLVFALLNNYPDLHRQSFKPFTLKAYQALGSTKHQAELHTLGLYNLLQRLQTFKPKAERAIREIVDRRKEYEMGGRDPQRYPRIDQERMIKLVEDNSEALNLEDIVNMDPKETEKDFAILVNLTTRKKICEYLGINYKEIEAEKGTGKSHLGDALRGLRDAIVEYLGSITSLGIPIVYRENGKTKILTGPYASPLGIVVTHGDTISKYMEKEARRLGVDPEALLNWHITNNGFIDLRAEARVTTAKRVEPGLEDEVCVYETLEEFKQDPRVRGDDPVYFTSSGITATVGRIKGLLEKLEKAHESLGTQIGWRALFPISRDKTGREVHPLIPGVVEAMRMYMEGLGKSTGTENLYPGHGYFPRSTIRRTVNPS